jgi:hypothetical protein
VAAFELQFPAECIRELAARFSYEDDAGCRKVGATAARRGHYTRSEFLTVCSWKTARSGPRVAANSEEAVTEATGRAFGTSSEQARMAALISLEGVGVPTGSALLLFAFPDAYPILDVRALESLGVKARTQYPVSFWVEYLDACRGLANRHGISMRTFDKALWQHSKERSS